jgi:hypothetical protein
LDRIAIWVERALFPGLQLGRRGVILLWVTAILFLTVHAAIYISGGPDVSEAIVILLGLVAVDFAPPLFLSNVRAGALWAIRGALVGTLVTGLWMGMSEAFGIRSSVSAARVYFPVGAILALAAGAMWCGGIAVIGAALCRIVRSLVARLKTYEQRSR